MSPKREIVSSLIILFMITVMTSSPFGYAVTWSDDQRLTDNSEVDWLPAATTAADGKLWVVWRSDRDTNNGSIYYKIFDGVSWTEDTRLTWHPSINDYPAITSTSDGKIWVVWVSDRVEENENLFYKVFDGVSWSDEMQLTTDPYPDTMPSVAETSDGKIWVAWVSPRFEMQGDLFYKVFDGVSWTDDLRMTEDITTIEEEPSIVQMADGNIWVAFTKIFKLKNKDIYYKVYNGTSWSPDIQLTWDYYHDFDPSIMQAQDGTIWLVWDSDRNLHDNNIYYKFYYGTWSPDTKLTTHLSDDLHPTIAQTPDQTIWVFWGSLRQYPPNYDIYYKTQLEVHDLAVLNVTTSNTTVVRGDNVSITVTVANQGTTNETFDVRCYANSTLIGYTSVSLTAGENVTLPAFIWDTTGVPRGNYIIKAIALSVPLEVDVSDNFRNADSPVEVRIKGDVCGMYGGVMQPIPNGVVDLDDLMAIAMPGHIFTEYPTWDPVWGPLCDVNRDDRVSVGDLLECGLHLGEM